MSSLEVSDQEAAAVAVAPRVTLADIEAAIARRYDFTAGQGVECIFGAQPMPEGEKDPLDIFSMCILVLKNGWVVTGESAPASPENFNADLGKKLAYENAVRKIWPLMGFSLRDRLLLDRAVTEDKSG